MKPHADRIRTVLREAEAAKFAAQGMSTREIAAALAETLNCILTLDVT